MNTPTTIEAPASAAPSSLRVHTANTVPKSDASGPGASTILRSIRIRMALDLAEHLAWKALYFSSRYPRSLHFASVARKHADRAERLRRFAHA